MSNGNQKAIFKLMLVFASKHARSSNQSGGYTSGPGTRTTRGFANIHIFKHIYTYSNCLRKLLWVICCVNDRHSIYICCVVVKGNQFIVIRRYYTGITTTTKTTSITTTTTTQNSMQTPERIKSNRT